MTIDYEQLLLIICSIGVINGFLLAIYFLFLAKPKSKHHIFLGGLLLALSIRIGKSIIFYFYPYSLYMKVYLQFGLTANFLIGPLLYLYIYYYLGKDEKLSYWKYHLWINAMIIIAICLLLPYWEYIELWKNFFFKIIHLQRILYLIMSGILINQVFGLISSKVKDIPIKKKLWLRSIFWGNVFILLAYILIGFGSYILGAVLFSFFLYLLVFILILPISERSIIIHQSLPKYGGRILEVDAQQNIIHNLNQILSTKELYCNPNLKIKDVAQEIETSTHHLSQVINEQLGKNFNQLINEYRINKAKEMIVENQNFTLEAIGYDCGFKAKSTFYAAFKKITGMTPSVYKKNNLNSLH